MASSIVVTRLAQLDLQDAWSWYEERVPGLGDAFVDCIQEVFIRLEQFPAMHRTARGAYRRALVRRFPYEVFYRIEEGRIFVVAVIHCAQDPSVWRERLK